MNSKQKVFGFLTGFQGGDKPRHEALDYDNTDKDDISLSLAMALDTMTDMGLKIALTPAEKTSVIEAIFKFHKIDSGEVSDLDRIFYNDLRG